MSPAKTHMRREPIDPMKHSLCVGYTAVAVQVRHVVGFDKIIDKELNNATMLINMAHSDQSDRGQTS